MNEENKTIDQPSKEKKDMKKYFQLPERNVNKEYPFYFKLYNWKTDGMIFIVTSLIIPLIALLICGLALRMGHDNPVWYSTDKNTGEHVDLSPIIYLLVMLISNGVGFYMLYRRDSKLFFKSGLSIYYWFIFIPQLVSAIVGIVLSAANVTEKNNSAAFGMVTIWTQIVSEIIVLYLAFRQTSGVKERILMTLKENWRMLLIIVVIAGGIMYGLSVGFAAIPGLNGKSSNQDQLTKPFAEGSTVYKVFYAISLFILVFAIAPLTEELATRHAIYSGIGNRWLAFFIAAIYFAMMHVQGGDVEHIVPYLVGGFCLSGVFSISRGNVTYDTGTHMLFNLIGFILIVSGVSQ